ncbi:flagellar hook-basal body complex protein [Neobacillus sp. YIM B06451]|uniref:flagellar hook-basal body complex protein n=1 Tax=Neobacillus sp. YIM B06451 TaxID=3070994 RepID=UPI00292FDE0F|nr:flagellar hook-basal body complex protein [Neobacillus sp. YIM B06451]
MLRSLNSGVSGLKAFQTKLDVIGNNIANVNTVGFKKSRVVFEDIFSQTVKGASAPTATPQSGGTNPIQVGLGTKVASIDTVSTPGSPSTTNVGTDLYIDGDGFFQVRDASGKPYLTRAGNFMLDQNRQLVNPNGMLVLNELNSPITINATDVSFSISKDGSIVGVDANGVATTYPSKIKLVKVDNPGGLSKVGGSLYSETPNAKINTTAPRTAQIISGALEMSNVDLSEEMTDMITAQRGFQANAKIITVSDSVLEELVNLKR